MSKQKKVKKYVNHLRYGSEPLLSSENIPADSVINSYWRYSGLKLFLETAIAADTSKQNYSIYPRSIYVDIEETCEVCRRPFIFFAQEQKHWFESLGFWIDAHCTRCIECRKKDQEVRLMQKRYQELVSMGNRAVSESYELKKIAMELYQLGYIRDANKLNIEIPSL